MNKFMKFYKILYLIILSIQLNRGCGFSSPKPNIIIDKLEDYDDINDTNLVQKLREICKIDNNVKDEYIKKEYDNIISYFINSDKKYKIGDVLEKKKLPTNYVYNFILIFKYDNEKNNFTLYKIKENHYISQFTEYFIVEEYNIRHYYENNINIKNYSFPKFPISNDDLINLFKDIKADYLMLTLNCDFRPNIKFLIKDLSRRQEFRVEDCSKKLQE